MEGILRKSAEKRAARARRQTERPTDPSWRGVGVGGRAQASRRDTWGPGSASRGEGIISQPRQGGNVSEPCFTGLWE